MQAKSAQIEVIPVLNQQLPSTFCDQTAGAAKRGTHQPRALTHCRQLSGSAPRMRASAAANENAELRLHRAQATFPRQ